MKKKDNKSKSSKKLSMPGNIGYLVYTVASGTLFVYFILLFLLNPIAVKNFLTGLFTVSSAITCELDGKELLVGTNSDYELECDECSESLAKELKKNQIIYLDYEKNLENIRSYIISIGGKCE